MKISLSFWKILPLSIFYSLLTLCLLPKVVFAQTCDKAWKLGPICGKIIDYDTGLPIAGAQIAGDPSCSQRTTNSDGQGVYCINLNCSGNDPAIRYNNLVTVKASGYCTIKTRPIFGRIDSVNFYLTRNCNCSPSTDSLALVQMSNALNLNWPTTTPLGQGTWGGGPGGAAVYFSENVCVNQINMKSGVGSDSDYGSVANGTLPTSNFATLFGLQEFDSESGRGRFLSGTLPDMSNFKYLNYFRLKYSKMTGGIPASFGKLKNLTELVIINNPQLGGVIPPELGNARELGVLALSENNLTGSIPTELGNLKKLYEFYLDRNTLNGILPAGFGSCDSFHIFQVDSCINLTGSGQQIDFMFKKTKMRFLGLSHNKFSGIVEIPGNNINSSLLFVNLNNNRFDSLGIIPNRNLFLLTVKNNKLTFDDILPNMAYFNTSGQSNCIDGGKLSISGYAPQDSIFTEITYTKNVGTPLSINLGIDAGISSNVYKWYKNGTPYDTIIGSNTLTFNSLQLSDAGMYTCQVTNPNAPLLTLYSRKITLVVTPSLVDTTTCRYKDSLQLVALYNATNGANWTNKWILSQPITSWFGVTLNAQGCVSCLDLDGTVDCINPPITPTGNNLVGTIPASLDNLKSLTFLTLAKNKLTGSIPNFSFPNLKTLYLYDNQLSGTLPTFNMPKIEVLDVSTNQLTGTIPNYSFPNLSYLDLYSNQLTGTIPNFNMPNMGHLHLSYNQLTGTIPNFTFPRLFDFIVNDNKLTGIIPKFNFPNLGNLQLHNNQLSGCIPKEIKTNCPLITATGGNISNNQNLATTVWANYWNGNAGACLACTSIISSISGTTDICTTGSTTLTAVTNAIAPTYLWSTGATTATITASTTGTYSVTVSQSDGCTNPAMTTVTSNTPSVIATPNSRCGTGTVSLRATASAGTLNWYAASTGGTSLDTGTTFITPSISTTTTYYVAVTNNGCTSARIPVIATIKQIPSITQATSASHCSTGSVILQANASAGTLNWYAASTGGISLDTGTTFTTPSISTTTTYYVEATNNGCTSARTPVMAAINPLPNSTLTPIQPTCGQNNGSITATITGGKTPYTYLWSNGATTASVNNIPGNTTPTTYIFTATDANSCSTSTSIQVSCNCVSASTPSVVASQTSNCGTKSTTLSIPNSPLNNSTNWQWYNNTCGGTAIGSGASITVSPASTTTYYVRGEGGCANGNCASITITVNPVPTIITPSVTDVKCKGNTDGIVTLSATGGTGTISFSINPLAGTQTSGTFTGLAAQTYTFTATDSKNCTATATATVAQPATNVSFSAPSVTNVKCKDGSDGKIILSASGGVGAIRLSISPNIGSQAVAGTFEGLTAQTYIFTATDNSGCTATRTAVVNQPTLALSLGNPVVSNVKCNGGTDGRIVASAVGGTGTISYSLTPSLGTQTPIGTFNNLTAQTYTLTATDINACRTAKTIPITQPTALTSVLTKTDVSSCLPTNGSAVATVSGGTAPYSYLWSNNARTQTATNLTAGTYKLTITDASGCTQNATTTINSLVDSLSVPSVIATYIGIDSIIFSWTAVPNAIRYEVKINKGNWIPAKNNLGHAVTGLKPFETVVFMVRAVSNSTSCSGKIGSIQEKTKKESCIGDLVDNIPNGFTPGSNGTNDFFDPQKYLYIAGCSDNVTAIELYIYNRWGEMLFKANPYEKWDGKSTSQQRVVPTGVYFYILIVNDNGVKKSVKGTLNVFAD